jgi:hypothetical protein
MVIVAVIEAVFGSKEQTAQGKEHR